MVNAKRRQIPGNLAFGAIPEGEAQRQAEGRAEAFIPGNGLESPAVFQDR